MSQFKGKPQDLPDERVGRPWLGEKVQTEVNFCPRCERITTNEGLCDKCIAQSKEFEVENVDAK